MIGEYRSASKALTQDERDRIDAAYRGKPINERMKAVIDYAHKRAISERK